MRMTLMAMVLLGAGAAPALAQQIDCSDPANAEVEQCLAQVDARLQGIRNFAPLLGPLLGGGALAALAAGQAVSTPNTNQ